MQHWGLSRGVKRKGGRDEKLIKSIKRYKEDGRESRNNRNVQGNAKCSYCQPGDDK